MTNHKSDRRPQTADRQNAGVRRRSPVAGRLCGRRSPVAGLFFLLLLTAHCSLLTVFAQDTPGILKCPAAVDTLDSLFRITDGARATTTSTTAVNATSIVVDSTAGFDITGSAKIGSEVFSYTVKTPTSFSGLTRGASGTTIASHASGSLITGPLLAAHHNILAAAVICAQARAFAAATIVQGDYGANDENRPAVTVGSFIQNTNALQTPAGCRRVFFGYTGSPDFWAELLLPGPCGPISRANGGTEVTSLAALITALAIPYDLRTQVTGKPASAAVVLRFVAIRPGSLAATGHRCAAGTAATAQTDFVLAVNGASKGTLRFAAAGTTCSIVSGATASIVAGDVVTITAPTQDATLAEIAFSIFATLP